MFKAICENGDCEAMPAIYCLVCDRFLCVSHQEAHKCEGQPVSLPQTQAEAENKAKKWKYVRYLENKKRAIPSTYERWVKYWTERKNK